MAGSNNPPLSFPFISLLSVVLVYSTCIIHKASPVVLVSPRNHRRHSNNGRSYPNRRHVLGNSSSSCDLFIGSWVRDDTYPLYQFTCPFIDPEFNCQMFGRPDTDYLKFRWQPANCQIPRFNGLEFARRMRGRSVMFVGDSLGRNQWESLVCLIASGLPSSSPTQLSRGSPLSTITFLEYGLSVSFYKAPYLVDIDAVQGKRVLRLDDIRGNANAWAGVDVLSFNTGHWWTHQGSSLQGWDYMEADGQLYEDMERSVAMERGLRTWARWVDSNVDYAKTRVFFQSISPTHYNPSEWNAGAMTTSKSCYGETMPIITSMSSYGETYSNQMKVVESVLNSMNKPPFLLDITLLSELRKDAHPSIYSGDLTPEQQSTPELSIDCSHWCLPGLPDTWNQLFSIALLFLY